MFRTIQNSTNFLRTFKFNSFNHLSRTIIILADGNGTNQNQTLCTGMVLNFENNNSALPFKKLNKFTLKNYEFPSIKFQYTRKDVVEHALSVGVKREDPYSFNYLTPTSPNFQVLPSFPFPLTNKILLDMAKIGDWMSALKTLHGEHYIEIVSPIPGEGIIDLRMKTLDVLDKGKGTLYCYSMNGYEPNADRLLFKSEYQMFEVGTGGWDRDNSVDFTGSKSQKPKNPQPQQYAVAEESPETTTPDAILEFHTVSIPNGTYKDLSQTDLKICAYSHTHPRQYYSRYDNLFPEPICHGRYFLGGTFQKILGHYAQGNSNKFKSGRVRFTNPVFPNEHIQIKTWTDKWNKNKILFEGNVKRTGNKTINVMKNGIVKLHN